MQGWHRVLVIAGISALCPTTVNGASPEEGKAAFERREDTMKRIGRPLYLGIGRVVKGTVAYGPGTVGAAETVAAPRALSTRPCSRRVRTWRRAGSSRRFSPPRIA